MVPGDDDEKLTVEVTLTEPNGIVPGKNKSCWFPFKKQAKNRKSLTVGSNTQVTSTNWDENGEKTSTTARSRQSSNQRRKGGSVSTVTDTSFLSSESRGTAGAGSHNSSLASETKSKFSCSRNTTSNYSYESNINSIVEKSFMEHNQNRKHSGKGTSSPSRPGVDETCYLEDAFDDDESIVLRDPSGNRKIALNNNVGGELPTQDTMASIETNCVSKEFWTDEAVDGGAFACIAGRKKKSDSSGKTQMVNNEEAKESQYTSSVGNDTGADAPELKTDLPSGEIKNDSVSNSKDTKNPFGNVMRFVSQDPEDENDSTPFRRIMCSSVSLRNRKAGLLCRNKEQTRLEDKKNPVVIQDWKQCNVNESNKIISKQLVDRPGDNDDEQLSNFYVEVEAMKEQLDGVKDLEVIEAEREAFDEDIANARKAPLVDKDSTFMESSSRTFKRSLFSKSACVIPGKQLDIQEGSASIENESDHNALSDPKVSNNKKKSSGTKDSVQVFQAVEMPSREETMRTSNNGRSLASHRGEASQLGERYKRQDKLISEMVTERVLGMKLENGTISESMARRRDETMLIKGSSMVQPPPRSPPKKFDVSYGRLGKPISKQFYSPPRVISPKVPSSGSNDLNISALTDSSYDGSLSRIERRKTAPDRIKKQATTHIDRGGKVHKLRSDATKSAWQESEIGYFRRVDSKSHRSDNAAFSPPHGRNAVRRDSERNSNRGPKAKGKENAVNEFSPYETKKVQSDVNMRFDENFWKEDTDDLNTEAFEVYGSEDDDSVFDDLRSHSSIQNKDGSGLSKEIVKPSQETIPKSTDFPRYSISGDSSRCSRTSNDNSSRRAYLQ